MSGDVVKSEKAVSNNDSEIAGSSILISTLSEPSKASISVPKSNISSTNISRQTSVKTETSGKSELELAEAPSVSSEKKFQLKRERGTAGNTSLTKKRKESATDADKEKESEDGQRTSTKNKKINHDEERMKMQLLVSHFSEDQLNRYEMFRRAAFPKAAIKRLMQSIAGTSVSQSVVIAMSGIAKVYVGEIVETALDVLEKSEETGPLQPKHIREAVRRIKLKNGVPTTKHKKILFH